MGKKKRPFVCLRVLTWINCFTGYEIELATWRAALIATFNRAYFSLPPFKRYLESVKQLWFPPTHWDLMILFISMHTLPWDVICALHMCLWKMTSYSQTSTPVLLFKRTFSLSHSKSLLFIVPFGLFTQKQWKYASAKRCQPGLSHLPLFAPQPLTGTRHYYYKTEMVWV